MQTLNALPDLRSNALLSMMGQMPGRSPADVRKPAEICGWFDSSLDLAKGLEVTEEDNNTMYQLWELSRR
ncbi:hypothetical protein [Roseateles sp.]|uniref:hypothetical protein n=1 Tax=Roseateles sp. TaxID=1971397 RepID=UPI003BABDEAA